MKNNYNRFGVSKKTFPTLLTTLLIVSSFFFTSGFASHVSADEIISPVEQTVTQEESAPADVVAPETPVVSEEPATSIIEEATPVVEEVVAPSEEPAPAPAEEQTPVPASVVLTAAATLSTEKDDYHPGQTATIFGKFFAPLQSFFLKVFGSDDNNENYTESTQTVTADETGAFTATYTLDSLFRPFYEMVASDFNGTRLASSWFRDAAIDIYNQCANDDGDGYPGTPGTCNWINGAINGNNSTYQEGDSTVQRLSIKGFEPGSSHSVTFTYGTTKQGKHAYDYLTTWNYSENWIALTDLCSGIVNCTGAGVVQSVFPIPQDPNANNLDSFVRNMTMRGGTITAVSVPSVVSGSYAGDSETAITVTFNVDPVDDANDMCSTQGPTTSCTIGIWFGAHVAKTADWQAFNGTGAGSIPGSPYHVALSAFDGDSVGNRDNQMQASAIPSTIIIHKDTSPDSPQDFNFTTSGTGLSSFTLDDDNDATLSNTKIFTGLKAGTFSVTEAAFSGYGVSISCIDPTGNTTFNNTNRVANISLGDAETVECTFTNTLQSASLTLVKNVTNDNGGNALATAWTLSATGPTNISGTTGSGAVTNASVNAGVYTLAETGGPSGYSASNWSCTAGTLNGSQLTLAAGQNATCTITNDDQPATLIVKKIVNNGNTGATKTASDFSFSVNAGTAVAFESDGQNDNTVSAGTYTVTEPAVAGYTTTYNNCSNLVIPNGGTATCTITNTAIAPTLTLVKTVLNDNGGTASVSNFQGKIDGNNVAWSTAIPVSSGAHTASEVSLPTYTASAWGGDCAADGSVTLALGENKTCTITNDDIAPKLHLRKVVVNNNGGTKTVADFTLTADGAGANDISGTSPVDSTAGLKADTFALSETNMAGYTASAWSCVGGTQSGSNITLGLNEEATCTITNDDQPAQIKIVKNTVGGDGTFSYIVTGPLPGSPNISTTNGTGTTGFVEVSAGNYTITEGSVAGWDMTGATCDVGTPASISLANGQSVTCTFENTKRGHLIVEKTTLPAGDTTSFSITASGTGTITGGGVGSITDVTDKDYEVTPGTYSVTETVPAGWDKTADTCQNVVVGAGETKTCTITNTKRGTIVIVKNAINNDAQDFTFNNNFANGNPATFLLDDDSSDTLPNTRSFEVLPGTYAVSETAVSGWKQNGAVCDLGETADSIDVGPGETVTCTFTNTKLAKITLVKNTVGGESTFNFTMSGQTLPASATLTTVAGTANQVFNDIDSDNTYSIAETAQTGWVNTSATCSNGDPVTAITPNAGEEITCTFTNNKPDAKIILSPLTATNKVGDDHVVTATVSTHNGDGVWTSAVNGTLVTFTLPVNTPGATFNGGISTCTTTAGTCSITINSTVTGHIEIHASSDPVVLTLPLHVETGVGANNSADAQKDYVNARIAIASTETNKVGDPHTFTVTVSKDTGSGFTGVAGVNPVVTFTPSNPGTITDNCATTGTDANGQCTVIINSSVAGIFTATAGANISVNSVPFNLATNNQNGNSAPAVKTYVDVKISIGQDGVNEVGDPHTFTGHVDINHGSGWENAPAGTVINFTASGPGTLSAPSCTTVGTTGSCTVTLTSTEVGTTVVNASTDALTDGLLILRNTSGQAGNSGPATKKWVDAYITIGESATNNITDPHTFTITVTQIPGEATPASTVAITPSVNPAPSSQSTTCGPAIAFTGNTATCTFTINSNTPGVFQAGASAALSIGGTSLIRATDGIGSNSGPATKTYVAGALEITKVVQGLASVVNKESINDTFTVTVTGPSYPSGHNITFNLVNGVLQVPATVGLSNLIPGDYTVTEADAGTEWTEVVASSPVAVLASATSTATVTNTYVPGSLDVTKSVALTGYLFASSADGTFTINVTGPSYPVATPLTFTLTDGVLVPATQSLANLIPGSYTVTEVDPGVAWTMSGNDSVSVASGQVGSKTVTNTVKIPNTTIAMTPSVWETTSGGNVTLTITDTNDGQVPISSPSVELLANAVVTTVPTYVSGDTNTNSIMDVGETWTWTWTGAITANTEFTVNGIGTDPLGNPVNGPTYASETTKLTVKVIGATRTIGFWQTHTDFTTKIFNNYLNSSNKFVGENANVVDGTTHKGKITTVGQLFGGFYAPIAKTTTGAKRTPVDQARVQMLQQLLAAKLNCAAFNCSQVTINLIASADAAYKAGDKNLINSLAGQLDAFNNSGDNVAINPTLGVTGKATPSLSKSLADLVFWNKP